MSNFSPERTHAMYEWQEKDEFNLLLAVQAISQESVENYNPKISLFDRIEIGLNKKFSYEVILSKIKELKQRFYKTRGRMESSSEVKRNKVFLISEDIWGRKENNGELGSTRSLENGNVEAEDGIKDAESGSGNEMVDVEDREEDGQSGFENDMMEVEEEANNSQWDMADVIVEMKDKENANLGGIENETMEPKDKDDFRRDEITEMEDMEKDPQRDFKKETMDVNDKKNEIKSDKAVQIGVRCAEAVKLNSIVSPSVNILKHAIKFRHKNRQFNVGGIDAKSNVRIQPAYKVLKNRTSMQKDSNGEILCFRCGKVRHMKRACTLENKIMEPLTEEQSTIGTLKGAGLEFEILSKSKEASTAVVLSKDNESKCMESNKCGKSFNVTNKRRLRTVLLERRKQRHNLKSQPVSKKQTVLLKKRKQLQNLKSPPVNKKQTLLLEKRKKQQNLKSPPVNKKQKTGVKLYECGNLGDTASCCVQRKVAEHPTKKQETSDSIMVGQLEATTNKAVELSNESEPMRSEPVPKEHTANKNMEEKSTMSESVSYCHTSDNMIAEISGNSNPETTDNKAVEPSSTTKPISSEPVTKERRANKSIEEKAAISESDDTKPETSGQFKSKTTNNKAVDSSNETKNIRSKPVAKENEANKNFEEKAAISESDDTKAETSGQFKSKTTDNKAVDSPNETKNIRSKPVAKENKANKNFEEKTTISESCSYHHTSDNAKAEGAGNFKYETTDKKGIESSNETKSLRSEPGSNEHKSNKNSEEKVTISKSSSYHQTSEETSGNSKFDDRNRSTLEQRKPPVNQPGSNNELTSKKNLEEKSISLSRNGKQTSEQKNTNEHSSHIPHDSTSEQRMIFDSELRRESLPNNCETVRHQSSHEHKKESSNSRQIETHHRYGQRYDEWRQYSSSRSPSVLHGHTHANSYQPTPSRKAEDVHRVQSVSHQYSFESLSPRTHSNYNTGYANNLRRNVSHLQEGGYHNQLIAQRAEFQYIQGQMMRERDNLNQSGYNYAYWHSYNGRDAGRHQSYATQLPPLPTNPYPYPPPPPHTEPYWRR